MTERLTHCIKCGTPLQQPDTGRPRAYCSAGCRRAAEKEIGRLNDHLKALETRRMETRLGYGLHSDRDLASLEIEIERAEARMREILDAAPE